MSSRCRSDPEFALSVYARIATDRGRAMFLEIYGASLVRGASTTGRVPRAERTGEREEEELEIRPPPPEGE